MSCLRIPDWGTDNGLIVAPPSLHQSGRLYAWEVTADPEDTPLAPVPDWLLTLFTSSTGPGGHGDAGTPGWLAELLHAPIGEGGRHTSMVHVVGYLLRRYVDPRAVAEFASIVNTARCRPPLPDEEVRRIVADLARSELSRRQGVIRRG